MGNLWGATGRWWRGLCKFGVTYFFVWFHHKVCGFFFIYPVGHVSESGSVGGEVSGVVFEFLEVVGGEAVDLVCAEVKFG